MWKRGGDPTDGPTDRRDRAVGADHPRGEGEQHEEQEHGQQRALDELLVDRDERDGRECEHRQGEENGGRQQPRRGQRGRCGGDVEPGLGQHLELERPAGRHAAGDGPPDCVPGRVGARDVEPALRAECDALELPDRGEARALEHQDDDEPGRIHVPEPGERVERGQQSRQHEVERDQRDDHEHDAPDQVSSCLRVRARCRCHRTRLRVERGGTSPIGTATRYHGAGQSPFGHWLSSAPSHVFSVTEVLVDPSRSTAVRSLSGRRRSTLW